MFFLQPDETLDASPVRAVFVEVPKADCHNRWTVGVLRADCKPLVLRTALHRFEEGAVSVLTKLEAALTLRRNLSERHVYDQLSRHGAELSELRLIGKLRSRQEEQDQACSFRQTNAQDTDVRSLSALCPVFQLDICLLLSTNDARHKAGSAKQSQSERVQQVLSRPSPC